MLFEDISVAGLCSDPTAFGSFKVMIKLLKMVPCLLVTYFCTATFKLYIFISQNLIINTIRIIYSHCLKAP